ncbi:MAG: hypothetical protein ABL961_06345 [Vicinamibacterales bacterium]
MFKRLLQLAVFAIIAHAAYRVGDEYLTFISFRDAVRDAAMFKATNDEELVARIMDVASDYGVPQEESALSITRTERQVNIDGRYDKAIEILPSYFYTWRFAWSIQATVSMIVPPYRRLPNLPPRSLSK